MAKKRGGRRRRPQEIVIDLPGVDRDTTVGALTVSQFISLLMQFSEQVSLARNNQSKTNYERVLAMISKAVNVGQPRDPFMKHVVEAQQNLLEQMPKTVRELRPARRRRHA